MTIRVELNPEMEKTACCGGIGSRHCAGVVCAAAPPGSNCCLGAKDMRAQARKNFAPFWMLLRAKRRMSLNCGQRPSHAK